MAEHVRQLYFSEHRWGISDYNARVEKDKKRMTPKNRKQKPDITYPCKWQYKIIGMQKETLKQAVRDIVKESPHSLTPSRSSRTGKYISYNLEVFVNSEEVRDYYFEELRSHAAIKIVL